MTGHARLACATQARENAGKALNPIYRFYRPVILSNSRDMTSGPKGAPRLRRPRTADIKASLSLGLRDFLSAPLVAACFSGVFVIAGLLMTWITYVTGQTFWLVLAVLGFPLVGTLAAVGFYEISRRIEAKAPLTLASVLGVVWSHRTGQLPWLATIIVVIFLFWFFLGHMIFALFLGLSPMTNVSTSLDVFLTTEGLSMLGFGTLVGAGFAALVFSLSVMGMPMLIDREVDFMTAMLSSMSAVGQHKVLYLIWGVIIAVVTLVSMIPLFLGLFVTMPVLGHATWHLYRRVAEDPEP